MKHCFTHMEVLTARRAAADWGAASAQAEAQPDDRRTSSSNARWCTWWCRRWCTWWWWRWWWPPDSWTYLHLFVHSVIHKYICALVYIPATKLYSAILSTTCVQCFLHIFVLFIISAFQLQRINIFPCANICWLLFRPGICIWTLPKSLDICWRFVRKRVSLG